LSLSEATRIAKPYFLTAAMTTFQRKNAKSSLKPVHQQCKRGAQLAPTQDNISQRRKSFHGIRFNSSVSFSLDRIHTLLSVFHLSQSG
jgi:hypothetical protein